jgi:signal transduction histidine kinase
MEDRSLMHGIARAGGGVRFRTTVLATVVVGLALALAGIALVSATRASLTDSVGLTAESRAQDIAVLVEQDALPVPIPGRGEALVAQVISADGKVLSHTADIAGEEPLIDVSLAVGETLRKETVEPGVNEADQQGHSDSDRILLVGLGVQSANGPVSIVVAASLDPVAKAQGVLIPVLFTVLPVILMVIAGLVWVLVGRALTPVEDIRAQAAAIGGEALDLRVPVPAPQDEIHRLAVTMNDMLDRLDASAQARHRFVADASHELRSPVAAMRTMLEVAQRPPDAIDTPTLLDDLMREDLRLERLTEDLLILARSDEHALSMKIGRVDVRAILAEEVAAARHRTEHEITLAGCAGARVTGDRGRITQVVRNLLENALCYSDSKVWVECSVENRWAVLLVSDDGVGIPESERERIFERFVRLEDARSRALGGTGLGLAVCRALVAQHGGTIACVEPVYGGATFEVRLPLVQDHGIV